MRNRESWKPSKFVRRQSRLRASRDRSAMSVPSRLIGDLVSARYDRYLPHYCRGRLIDLGCGRVPFYETYRPYVSDNICVDWANSAHDRQFLDVECDLSQPLPFGSGSFDTVILSDVLEHVVEPRRLWEEMSRVLTPGGCVLLNVPFYYRIHEEPHDFYRYTEFALRCHARDAGFEIQVLESVGGVPETLTDIIGNCVINVPVIGAGLVSTVQLATRLLLRTGPGKAISRKTEARFPLGYFLVARKAESPRKGAV